VPVCVIFNPTARGEKARRFRHYLDAIGNECTLKLTGAIGDARRLAAEAVRENFDTIVAAGGDGTLNEVLNGIGDVPNGFERVRLGLLPLGTVNVFAKELGIPLKTELAWQTVRKGKETLIDLPAVEFASNGTLERRYFAQMAGAGLDARAIELVSWQLKKKLGPLAYVAAGLKALLGKQTQVTATDAANRTVANSRKETEASLTRPLATLSPLDGERDGVRGIPEISSGKPYHITGELVLIGNGRFYGGRFAIFPEANPRDGLLDVCVFRRTNWLTLVRCALPLLTRGLLPTHAVRRFRSSRFTLTSPARTALELDGELVGHLPATFSLTHQKLRVIVP